MVTKYGSFQLLNMINLTSVYNFMNINDVQISPPFVFVCLCVWGNHEQAAPYEKWSVSGW